MIKLIAIILSFFLSILNAEDLIIDIRGYYKNDKNFFNF